MIGELVLPADVLIIPVGDLPEAARRQLDAEGEFAVTRPRGRSGSSLVGAAVAELLGEFRQPSTVVDAVIRYSTRHVVDPEATLDGAYPVLRKCVAEGFLVEPGTRNDQTIEATLQVGDAVAGRDVVRCLQVLDDTELHQVAGDDGRLLVLKLARHADAAAMRGVFDREIAALAHLGGVVAPELVETGALDGRQWLLMEWCEGVPATRFAATLRSLAPDRGEPRLQQLFVAIADAYASLHARGVVHGDVHPHNVLVGPDGTVRVIDFGLARSIDGAVAGLAARAPRGGVPAFFEPEYAAAVVAGRRPPQASEAGEVHAVAAMTSQLATGLPYLEIGLDIVESMRIIAEDVPPPFTRRGSPAWPDLELVLQAALHKDPAARTPSMAALRDALAAVRPSTAPATDGQLGTASAAGTVDRAAPVSASALASLVDAVVAAARPGGVLYDHGHAAPRASVTYGSAGVAAGLLRIAVQRDDPELLVLADTWACRAARDAQRPDAFTSAELAIDDELVGLVTPYHRMSGVHLVQALVSHAANDVLARQAAVDGFVAESAHPCANLDLTLGRTGTLVGATLLLQATRHAQYARCEGLVDLGRRTLADLWLALDSYDDVARTTELPHLGIAHGWAGVLLGTLRWCDVGGDALPSTFGDRLEQLAALAEPAGRGVRWRWSNGHGGQGTSGTMPGWCNGSAGHVHLWTAAHRRLGDERFLDLAERAAWDASTTAAGVAHLCCGSAGQAYALLDLHRHTGEQRWLAAARELGGRGAHEIGHGRHGLVAGSLYKGELGVAALAADLERPEMAAMPLFGDEGW